MKRIFSLLLCALLLLSAMPITALAQELEPSEVVITTREEGIMPLGPEVEPEEKPYVAVVTGDGIDDTWKATDLVTAIGWASHAGTTNVVVTLYCNQEERLIYNLNGDTSFTLDLNGNSIKGGMLIEYLGSDQTITITNGSINGLEIICGGNLVLGDGLKITSTEEYAGALDIFCFNWAEIPSNIVVDGAEIEGFYGVEMTHNAKLTVKSGTITGSAYGVHMAHYGAAPFPSTLTLPAGSTGVITTGSAGEAAVFVGTACVLNQAGGQIIPGNPNAQYTVLVQSGDVNVSGGILGFYEVDKYNMVLDAINASTYWNNQPPVASHITISGDAQVYGCVTLLTYGSINMTGGTLNACNTHFVSSRNAYPGDSNYAPPAVTRDISITGGMLNTIKANYNPSIGTFNHEGTTFTLDPQEVSFAKEGEAAQITSLYVFSGAQVVFTDVPGDTALSLGVSEVGPIGRIDPPVDELSAIWCYSAFGDAAVELAYDKATGVLSVVEIDTGGGDVPDDSDAPFDVLDLQAVYSHIHRQSTLTDDGFQRLDVNEDEIVNVLDQQIIYLRCTQAS